VTDEGKIKLLVTTGIIIPLVLILAFLCLRVKERENDVQINLVILILGGCVGWLLGILLSPYGSCEKEAFAEYAAIFGTFVSGYLIGKIDPFVGKVFSPDFLLQRIVAFRVTSFLSILLLSMLMTFAVRVYLPNEKTAGCVPPTLTSQSSGDG